MGKVKLTGQIEADFLDDSALEDIVTSDRQRLREEDVRVSGLLGFMRGNKVMGAIESRWSTLRNQHKTDELVERYPKISQWVDSLNTGWQSKARSLLGKIATMEIAHDSEQETGRQELLRSAIFGFERLRLRGDEEALEQALNDGVEALLKLLSDRDALESAIYRNIVDNRLEAIRAFQGLTDKNALERVLQEYLFDHLWLLDPSWERAAGSETMEERLRLKDEFKNDEATKKKYGRCDIRYRTVSGKHVIVELKRTSVRTDIFELAKQGAKYVEAVKAMLSVDQRDRAAIEVIFVVGREPDEPAERITKMLESVSPGSRLATHDQLIDGAKRAYDEYFKRTREIDFVDRMFDADQES